MKKDTYLIAQILEDGYCLPTSCVPKDMVVDLSEYYGEQLDFKMINRVMCFVLLDEEDVL